MRFKFNRNPNKNNILLAAILADFIEFISNFKINFSYLNYIQINNVKKKFRIRFDNENLLQ